MMYIKMIHSFITPDVFSIIFRKFCKKMNSKTSFEILQNGNFYLSLFSKSFYVTKRDICCYWRNTLFRHVNITWSTESERVTQLMCRLKNCKIKNETCLSLPIPIFLIPYKQRCKTFEGQIIIRKQHINSKVYFIFRRANRRLTPEKSNHKKWHRAR